MKKTYHIELPVYAFPLDQVIQLKERQSIDVSLYGGIPDSPLNGGRLNFTLDGFTMIGRAGLGLSNSQKEKAQKHLYQTITKANQNGIAFHAAFTNMFIGPEELTAENISPITFLAESSQRYGIKNGVIINNGSLEDHLRERFGNKILYIASCTKYVAPERILSPKDTIEMYKKDLEKFDFVVLTPQDSRRKNVLEKFSADEKERIIAIGNSYCADTCNTYDHYAYFSKENKRSLLRKGPIDLLRFMFSGFSFIAPRITVCPAVYLPFCSFNIKKIVQMQIESGITNFKLGRGFGDNKLHDLLRLLRHSTP